MAGSFGVQCAAVESFSRALAIELGPRGVRVNCLRSAGSPDSAGVDEVFDMHAGNAGVDRADYDREKASGTLLGRLPRLAEVAQTAVFLASDRASAITGSIANVTCGELLD
jgi:NAD(P)-dependent dehydrogenase (short-subunit alcohol dehydrogenase family)